MKCSVCEAKAMSGSEFCRACKRSYALNVKAGVRDEIEWAARRARKAGRDAALEAFKRKYGYRPHLEPKWYREGS